MENEEQASEEKGKTRFGNVFGTRTNTFMHYSLSKRIFVTLNYQQLMLYHVLRALN